MRLFVDLDLLQLVRAQNDRQPVTNLEYKRGDTTPLEIGFVRSGVLTALPTDAVLTFALKVKGQYDSDPLVLFNDFTAGTDPITYTGAPSFNTVELNTALHVDSDGTNDLAFIDLMGELSWAVADVDPVSIKTFTARVNNDVVRGDEGLPVKLPGPAESRMLKRKVTTDETTTALTLDGLDLNEDNMIPLPANQAVLITGTVHVRHSSGFTRAWSLAALINRGDGDAVFVGDPTPTLIAGDATTDTYDLACEISGSGDRFFIAIESNKAQWFANLTIVRNSYDVATDPDSGGV